MAYKKPILDVKTERLKEKGCRQMFSANGNEKKHGVAIVTSDIIVLKTKTTLKDKEKHNIIIKRSIQQENIVFINVYMHLT